ncbi:MAG: UDPGP type 1 family protein [Kineothrix sp.]|nr:UDPGP type 1 family protein [Kineothrix sp.]
MNYEEAYEKLERHGQLHVLKYYDGLPEEKKAALLGQIESLDFSILQYCKENTTNQKGEIAPLAAMQLPEIEKKKEKYMKIGIEEIRQGKVAAVLLAGGMGTRLGSDHPKGMYDIGLTRPVYIFQRIIENMLDVVRQAEGWVRLFVMTSDKNHDMTVEFFEEKKYFGYNSDYVSFFIQDVVPASDYEGKAYMEEPWKISTSPNGNGGWFSSMNKCGLLDVIKNDGIEWINVFAVDNVLQRIADPCFVGAVIDNGCVAGAKVVKKNSPDERVGALCLEDGRPSIVEYYELTDEMKAAKDADGNPAYDFGVILNYIFRTKELEMIMDRQLPLHVVEKQIPYMNEKGEHVEPETPNGYKYETLVLDMIHQVDNCLAYEVDRDKEFAPIKNATGIDSVVTARELCKKNGIAL